jgi:hypothetical protein
VRDLPVYLPHQLLSEINSKCCCIGRGGSHMSEVHFISQLLNCTCFAGFYIQYVHRLHMANVVVTV